MGNDHSSPEELRAAEHAMATRLGVELHERWVETDGPVRRVRVLETGDGPPLVLVHGGGGFAAQWLPLMAALPDRRCLAIERPGCGLTDGHVYGADEPFRAHAVTHLEHVLDALQVEQADLVGSSMGGLWSLWLALDRPQRVQSLTMVGCPALVVGTAAPFPMRVLTRRLFGGLMAKPQSASGMARVVKMLGHDPAALDVAQPGMVDLFRIGGNLPGAGDSFLSLLRRVLRLRGARPDCSLGGDELAKLPISPMAVWGEHDPFGDAGAARRFSEATGGDLRIVGTGHLPWLDEPAEVAAAISEHLASLGAAAPRTAIAR